MNPENGNKHGKEWMFLKMVCKTCCKKMLRTENVIADNRAHR